MFLLEEGGVFLLEEGVDLQLELLDATRNLF